MASKKAATSRRLMIIGAVALAVVALLALRSGIMGTGGPEPIRIAVAGPMGFVQGKHHWQGAQLAAEEINAAGGITIDGKQRPLELIQVDTNEVNSITDATNAVERAITRNDADFVTGGFRTEAVLAMQDVVMDYKKMFLGVGAAHNELGTRVTDDYERYKYWFRISPTKATDLGLMIFSVLDEVANQIREAVGRETIRVAILGERAVWADPLVEAAEKLMPELGIEVVGTWRPSPVATDVSSELSAINRTKADIIFTALSGPVGIVVGRQVGEMGLTAVPFGVNVEAQKSSFWEATNGKAQYLSTIDSYARVEVTDMTIPFINAYEARFGEYPLYTATTYSAITGLKDAIEAINSMDADKLVEYFENNTLDGPGGILKFDRRHDPIFGPGYATGVAVQWQDGEKVAFWPNGWEGVTYKGMKPFLFPTRHTTSSNTADAADSAPVTVE